MKKATAWYADGLRFKCTECGKCCTGKPGVVWVTPKEILEIANALDMPLDEFSRQYVRKLGNRYSIKEKINTYDCIFLRDKKCLVYQSRPTQCRTYPFWPEILQSKETWEEEARECEGISEEAPLIPFEQIQQKSKKC